MDMLLINGHHLAMFFQKLHSRLLSNHEQSLVVFASIDHIPQLFCLLSAHKIAWAGVLHENHTRMMTLA